MFRIYFLSVLLTFSIDCRAATYDILDEGDFDPKVFTQGFAAKDKHFFVSSGLYGRSFIEIQNRDGESILRRRLADSMFAEGLTLVEDAIYALTWKRGLAFKLDAKTLKLEKTFRYQGEGWGIAFDGKHLYTSDGSANISIRDKDNFSIVDRFAVTENSKPIVRVNELEYAESALWANIWQSDDILKIDPSNGTVISRYSLASLRRKLGLPHPEAVLNGIAYDTDKKAFWITGKLWPKRYLVKFKSSADRTRKKPTAPIKK